MSNTRHCCDEGLIFTGCSMTNTAATPSGGRRRQVIVGGKRVKTIDVHAHCVVAEALALLGQTVEEQRGPGIGDVGSRRLAEMDEQGIDMEALSINPLWYKAERDLAAEVVRIQAPIPTVLSRLHRWRCSIPNSLLSNWNTQ
jgi:aminocarboxymuconate-semialdehyde decarboxylase